MWLQSQSLALGVSRGRVSRGSHFLGVNCSRYGVALEVAAVEAGF